MTYMIRFPIGDWSDDGHGKCEYFEVQSNHPVQHVREVHFKAPEVIGFNIGDMCRNYEELSTEVVTKLNAIGIDPNKFLDGEIDPEDYYMDYESLINIWLAILNYIDPTLELEIIKSKAEDINFYGIDEKNRHLETPGYGVF